MSNKMMPLEEDKDRKIYAHLSVAENLILDRRIRKLTYEIIIEKVNDEIKDLLNDTH